MELLTKKTCNCKPLYSSKISDISNLLGIHVSKLNSSASRSLQHTLVYFCNLKNCENWKIYVHKHLVLPNTLKLFLGKTLCV